MSGREKSLQYSVDWNGGELQIAGATHVGRVRSVNQDAYAYFHEIKRGEILLVVADGLGGHRGGEVASQIGVEIVGEMIGGTDEKPDLRLKGAIEAANQSVLTAARKDQALDGMGTTIVCLLISENGPSFVAHVGDSRLYRVRHDRIQSITEDHSLVGTLVREGVLSPEAAREDPRRNQILRALGVREDIEVEVAPVQLQAGDRYLLCSDGLHGLVDDPDILGLATTDEAPEVVIASLVDAAIEAGGNDNVTCLVVDLPRQANFPIISSGLARFFATSRSLFRRPQSK
jgi:serine/threonine protein phosphatase PrpC